MPRFPRDNNADKIAFYGDPFRAGFERDNIVSITPPWQMRYTDDEGRVTPVHQVRIHKLCSVSLQTVFNRIWDHYGRDQHNIDAIGLSDFAGSFVKRNVRGSSSAISCHAFGAAIDLDPRHNPMNHAGNKGSMPPAVVAIFRQEGWTWGGDWNGRKDPMHFQAADTGVTAPIPALEDPVPPEPKDSDPMDDEPAQVATADGPKPLWKSNMVRAAATVGVSAGGDTLYQASDVLNTATNIKYSLNNLGVVHLLTTHPSFFLGLLCAVLAGYIIYKKWHDNKGAKNV